MQKFTTPNLIILCAIAASAAGQPSPRPTPPPQLAVSPIVNMPASLDTNANRVDDQIDDALTTARQVLRTGGVSPLSEAAKAIVDQPIDVELMFDQQITQTQIDAFIDAGGTITRVYQNISYGWTGSLPRGQAADLAATMGKSFLGVVEGKPLKLHMDEAARCGRVRPTVWNLGVKGDQTGADRITIAILDTGVDGTHTDLTGRMEYWKDWTSDAHATPSDIGHHGSHVTGIATGTGAASGVSPTTLKFTDMGELPSSGFFPSPLHIPLSITNVNWNTNLRWQTGVGVTKINLRHGIDIGGWAYYAENQATASPASLISSWPNPYSGSNKFSTIISLNTGSGSPGYAANSTVSYAAIDGDGYNTLSGVAPECMWAGLKVFTDAGSGSSLDIGEALDDLVTQRSTHNIRVANMSLGINGNPGIDPTTRNKTNTAASNGVVIVCSAGNDGSSGSGSTGEGDDPGRAQYAITVASTSDINQLTAYSSHGFAAGGDANAGDEDAKPDICAPGGSSSFQTSILSVDSNSGDENGFTDGVANDYLNIQGTSMASPFMAGCAALVIDAMQRNGEVWDTSGGAALADVLRVKMILLMTATETNQARESGPSGNPTLNRGAKDINEGYGIVNADAAVEAIMNAPYTAAIGGADTFLATNSGRRCWARRINMVAGKTVNVGLTVPSSGDYDMYLYAQDPNAYGNPQILASSTAAGSDTDENISYPVAATQTGYLVIKRVSGTGSWSLTGAAPVGISQFSLE